MWGQCSAAVRVLAGPGREGHEGGVKSVGRCGARFLTASGGIPSDARALIVGVAGNSKEATITLIDGGGTRWGADGRRIDSGRERLYDVHLCPFFLLWEWFMREFLYIGNHLCEIWVTCV
jgi:hypothetical protein